MDVVGVEHLLQHLRCLVNLNFPGLLWRLSGFKVLKGDVVRRLYQELQHEAGHFPRFSPSEEVLYNKVTFSARWMRR